MTTIIRICIRPHLIYLLILAALFSRPALAMMPCQGQFLGYLGIRNAYGAEAALQYVMGEQKKNAAITPQFRSDQTSHETKTKKQTPSNVDQHLLVITDIPALQQLIKEYAFDPGDYAPALCPSIQLSHGTVYTILTDGENSIPVPVSQSTQLKNNIELINYETLKPTKIITPTNTEENTPNIIKKCIKGFLYWLVTKLSTSLILDRAQLYSTQIIPALLCKNINISLYQLLKQCPSSLNLFKIIPHYDYITLAARTCLIPVSAILLFGGTDGILPTAFLTAIAFDTKDASIFFGFSYSPHPREPQNFIKKFTIDGILLKTIYLHPTIKEITSITIAGNGSLLISSKNQGVQLFDQELTLQRRVRFRSRENIGTLAVTTHNNLAFIALPNNTVRLYGLTTYNYLEIKLTGHTQPVHQIKMLPDATIITGSHDATCKIWELKTGACLQTLTHNLFPGYQPTETKGIVIEKDGTIITSDGTTLLYWKKQADGQWEIDKKKYHDKQITSLTVHNDGSLILGTTTPYFTGSVNTIDILPPKDKAAKMLRELSLEQLELVRVLCTRHAQKQKLTTEQTRLFSTLPHFIQTSLRSRCKISFATA